MKDFSGKLAVITGGGTGMGRALARQLVAEGCDVAMCDILEENLVETKRPVRARGQPRARHQHLHLRRFRRAGRERLPRRGEARARHRPH